MQRSSSPSSGMNLSSVDDIAAAAVQCGSNIAAVQHNLIPALKRLCNAHQGRGAQVLLAGAQNGSDPLTAINPDEHTAAYIFILCVVDQMLSC